MSINNPWLPQLKVYDDRQFRLFCFPYAGSGTLSFRDWLDYFPPRIGIYPVELPGRGFRLQEPPTTQLHSLVRSIADGIYPYLDKPFAFFGHSMGALISFELARFLRKEHQINPVHLFFSGRCAPQTPPISPPIHQLSKPDFLEALRHLNGTPKEVLENPELMELILPILRADFSIVETYSYEAEDPLGCPFSVFGGLQDPETTIDGLEAWKVQTTQETSIYLFSGNHFFIHSHRDELLNSLDRDLQKTLTNYFNPENNIATKV